MKRVKCKKGHVGPMTDKMLKLARDFVWAHWSDYLDCCVSTSASNDGEFLLLAEMVENAYGPPSEALPSEVYKQAFNSL